MSNPNIKLVIRFTNATNSTAHFMLYKGAQLDASIISPQELIAMNDGVTTEITMEERLSNQVLKGVMGECIKDFKGKCSVQKAVELIRALNHKQEVKLYIQ